ncbi:hypothetical protein DFJ77DRAFT_520030 [Powellomyces hirtus]|nr:hypothetical protein DFJ77DRAFT_520030 [Powellomyces hirtus]
MTEGSSELTLLPMSAQPIPSLSHAAHNPGPDKTPQDPLKNHDHSPEEQALHDAPSPPQTQFPPPGSEPLPPLPTNGSSSTKRGTNDVEDRPHTPEPLPKKPKNQATKQSKLAGKQTKAELKTQIVALQAELEAAKVDKESAVAELTTQLEMVRTLEIQLDGARDEKKTAIAALEERLRSVERDKHCEIATLQKRLDEAVQGHDKAVADATRAFKEELCGVNEERRRVEEDLRHRFEAIVRERDELSRLSGKRENALRSELETMRAMSVKDTIPARAHTPPKKAGGQTYEKFMESLEKTFPGYWSYVKMWLEADDSTLAFNTTHMARLHPASKAFGIQFVLDCCALVSRHEDLKLTDKAAASALRQQVNQLNALNATKKDRPKTRQSTKETYGQIYTWDNTSVFGKVFLGFIKVLGHGVILILSEHCSEIKTSAKRTNSPLLTDKCKLFERYEEDIRGFVDGNIRKAAMQRFDDVLQRVLRAAIDGNEEKGKAALKVFHAMQPGCSKEELDLAIEEENALFLEAQEVSEQGVGSKLLNDGACDDDGREDDESSVDGSVAPSEGAER